MINIKVTDNLTTLSNSNLIVCCLVTVQFQCVSVRVYIEIMMYGCWTTNIPPTSWLPWFKPHGLLKLTITTRTDLQVTNSSTLVRIFTSSRSCHTLWYAATLYEYVIDYVWLLELGFLCSFNKVFGAISHWCSLAYSYEKLLTVSKSTRNSTTNALITLVIWCARPVTISHPMRSQNTLILSFTLNTSGLPNRRGLTTWW